MTRAVLCAPNVSEGRDLDAVEAIAAAVESIGGVRLLDCAPDPDHHRTVLTYIGEPEAVLEATISMAEEAFGRIDMREHRGQHPRLGAVDVVPFVPVRGVTMEEAVELARRFGQAVAARGLPVYYYEAAALRPERRELPPIRSGEYEGLAAKLATPEWTPDEGPARFDPVSGAVVTGARPPLVRFNVDLDSSELAVAEKVARSVRAIGGGLPHLRAIWIERHDRGRVQVSLNLTRPESTTLPMALEAVRQAAAAAGVAVAESEIVGPVPLAAVLESARHGLDARPIRPEQVIEGALIPDDGPAPRARPTQRGEPAHQ